MRRSTLAATSRHGCTRNLALKCVRPEGGSVVGGGRERPGPAPRVTSARAYYKPHRAWVTARVLSSPSGSAAISVQSAGAERAPAEVWRRGRGLHKVCAQGAWGVHLRIPRLSPGVRRPVHGPRRSRGWRTAYSSCVCGIAGMLGRFAPLHARQ